jgi:hypothetical protein
MKKLILALAALLSFTTPAAARPHWNYEQFRVFIYNYNPTYRGPIWLGYDGIYRCIRPYYGTVGVLTDDWGRVLNEYNAYGVPRTRLRCR